MHHGPTKGVRSLAWTAQAATSHVGVVRGGGPRRRGGSGGGFFTFSKRLDDIIGLPGYRFIVLNDVMGMYQNMLPWVFTGLLTFLVVLYVLMRRASVQQVRNLTYLIRILIAFCLMMAIYNVINFYISVFNPFDRDNALQHIDRALFFGRLPSEWLQVIICKPLTLFFGGVYMSWFALTYITILVLMVHSRRAVVEYVFTAIFTFYIGYLTYLFVPAIGPVFTVHFQRALGGLNEVFASTEPLISRDCFPSLHTGISFVMLVSVWRYQRKWLWFYGPWVCAVVLSTLYLRFHYGTDVIAGAALATATCQLSPLFVRYWEQLRTHSFERDTELERIDLDAVKPTSLTS